MIKKQINEILSFNYFEKLFITMRTIINKSDFIKLQIKNISFYKK